MARSPEEALDELYAATPEEFVSRRTEIARRLRGQGDAAGAAQVAARRKPTRAAFVLNQVARRHADDLAALVDVGRELARAERRALRGDAGSGLREAIARQRALVAALTQKASALMSELGMDPGAQIDEISAAFRSALADPTVGASIEEGRLERLPTAPAAFSGIGAPEADEAGPAAAGRAAPKRRAHAEPASGTPPPKASAREEARRRAAAIAEREAERARRDADEQQQRATRAGKAADALTEESVRLLEDAKALAARARAAKTAATAKEREARRSRAAARTAALAAERSAEVARRAQRNASAGHLARDVRGETGAMTVDRSSRKRAH